jgi:mono/diheme cytochrome c family protein
MKKERIATFFILISAMMIGCLSSDDQKSTSKNVENDGKKIYQKYCSSCHGVQGDLGLNGAIHLNESSLNIDEKIIVVTKGRNTMTAFGNILSPDQIKSVVLYTEQFKSN